MRFSHLVISLPLLLCAAQFGSPFSIAQAAGMSATEATALLAKSHSINVKCSILNVDNSQSLKDFVARAEISLAEKASVSVARKTIATGRTAGKAATCDEAAKKLVNDVLAAANAAANAPVPDATVADSDEPQQLTPERAVAVGFQQNKAVAAVEPSPIAHKPSTKIKARLLSAKVKTANEQQPTKQAKPVKGLGSYAVVAEKYYVALRCGNMNASGISRLYKNVLANHQQALASNKPADVRAMLRSVEARAGSKSCG